METLNDAVDRELAKLPADIRARVVHIIELIESHGLPNVRQPYVKHVRRRVWEIRAKGKNVIARALYVTEDPQRVVIVRIFKKKTETIPERELKLALQRVRELEK